MKFLILTLNIVSPSEIQKYSVKVIDNSKFEILDVVRNF